MSRKLTMHELCQCDLQIYIALKIFLRQHTNIKISKEINSKVNNTAIDSEY